jgi:hypothetical protein
MEKPTGLYQQTKKGLTVPVPQNTEAAVAIYFETHDVPREHVEAAAIKEGVSLGEYCQSLLVSEAVQTACAQFIGMALSIKFPNATPVELMQRSKAAAVNIWGHEIMDGLPMDQHVARMLAATANEVQLMTSKFISEFDKDD